MGKNSKRLENISICSASIWGAILNVKIRFVKVNTFLWICGKKFETIAKDFYFFYFNLRHNITCKNSICGSQHFFVDLWEKILYRLESVFICTVLRTKTRFVEPTLFCGFVGKKISKRLEGFLCGFVGINLQNIKNIELFIFKFIAQNGKFWWFRNFYC